MTTTAQQTGSAIPPRKNRLDQIVAKGTATAADTQKKKKESPFLLEFRDADLRKQIRHEALNAEMNMSEYIVQILRARVKMPSQ